MSKVLDGAALAAKIKNELKEKVQREKIRATLAVILVGKDSASEIYVKGKIADCKEVGINSELIRFDENVSEYDLISKISDLNEDKKINGILVQLPLPKAISESAVLNAIAPEKDVDGFHLINKGKLFAERNHPVAYGATPPQEGNLAPCTPMGIIELLKEYDIQIEGKHCVVIGRSNIVGKPMAMLLLQENGTVTICHSKTCDIEKITKEADILVVAIGKPHFVTSDMVKKGAVIIDVGMNRLDDGILVGDVAFADVSKKAAYITPVPGGVGPMTRAMLLRNVVELCKG